MAYQTNGNNTHNRDIVSSSFQSFYEGWLLRLQHHLDQLLAAQNNPSDSTSPREEELREVISQVLSHYQQYYQEKARVACTDIFLLFSPSWFSPFERSLLWITGFKPGMLIRLVENSVKDLSEEQTRRLDWLRTVTREEEKQLSDELARIQESVAAPPLLELIRRRGRLINGEWTEGDRALETLSSSIETLVENADLLRLVTARRATEILNPLQNVRFLAATAQLRLRVRSWGWQREAEKRVH